MINFIRGLGSGVQNGTEPTAPPITGSIAVGSVGIVSNNLNARQRNITAEYQGTFFSTAIHTTGNPFRQQGFLIHGSAGNYVVNDPVTPPRNVAEGTLHSNVSTAIWNNTLYLFQTNPHNSVIDVYECNQGVDFGGTFTLIHAIPGNFAYASAMPTATGLALFQRGGPSTNYDGYVVTNNNSALTSWTVRLVTDRTRADSRHYPQPLSNWYDGTYYYCALLRRSNDNTGSPMETENALFFLKTQDFITWENQDGTFTKNVTVSPINDAELDSNFLIFGNPSVDELFIGTLYGHRRDDKFYFNCVDVDDNNLPKVRYYDGATWSNVSVPIPNLNPSINNRLIGAFSQIIHKGNRLYYIVNTISGGVQDKQLWSTDFNFQNPTFIQSFGDLEAIYLPENLTDIASNRITCFGSPRMPTAEALYFEFDL